jgi:hypothetical protein
VKKKDKLPAADIRRLNEFVHLGFPRDGALVICSWLRRMEESEALAPVLWQHDSERIVLRDLRVGLERVLAEEEGGPRLGMTRARALVLCNWLSRMDQSSSLAPLLGDDGVAQKVLWTLEGWLEHLLVFELHGVIQAAGPNGPESSPGYEALVRTAREEVWIDRLRAN